jgi:hypothetical protein
MTRTAVIIGTLGHSTLGGRSAARHRRPGFRRRFRPFRRGQGRPAGRIDPWHERVLYGQGSDHPPAGGAARLHDRRARCTRPATMTRPIITMLRLAGNTMQGRGSTKPGRFVRCRHGNRTGPLDRMQMEAGRCDAEEIWRRGWESNPSTRLCRPLHNRFATSPEEDFDYATATGYLSQRLLEREKSLELSTSTLARLRSTN